MIFLDLLSGNNFQTDDSQSTYLSFETNSFFQLNRRVSFARNSAGALQLKDNNDYYPFRMNHLKTGNSYFGAGSYVKYKFGGKELQETGMYDFGARMYMADVGRWFVTDPLAETNPGLSVYRYSFNNPVMFTDPNGMLEQAQIDHMWNNSGTGVTSWTFNNDGSPKMNSYNPMEDSDVNHLLAAFSGVASGGGSARISFFTGTATQTSYRIGDEMYGEGNFGQGHIITLRNNSYSELASMNNVLEPSFFGDFIDGFNSADKSSLKSASAWTGYAGFQTTKFEKLFQYTARISSSWADKAAALKGAKVSAVAGKGLGVLGVGLTVLEDYNQNGKVGVGTAVKVGIGLATTFAAGALAPWVLAYVIADVTVGFATGTTITDRIAAGVESTIIGRLNN